MSAVKNTKFWLAGIIALAVIVAIGIGAAKGRTRYATPAETRLAGSETGGGSKANDGKQLVTIRSWTRKNCTLAPLLVADKLGYFTEEGLKVVFTGEIDQAQQIPSVVNGNNDFGDIHPNNLAVAVAGGAPLTGVVRSIIEPGPDKDPKLRHMFWYANPKSGIKSFADLKNLEGKIKTNGYPNSCTQFLIHKVAERLGIPRDKFEWVQMTDIQAIQAVKQGQLTMAGVHPPFYKASEDAGLVKIGDSSDSGVGEAAGTYLYYFNNNFIKQNPEAVRAFVRAVVRAQKWANANPAQTAKWVEEAIGVPVTANHYFSEDGKINEEHIKLWVEDVENSGIIPRGKIKVSDIITHEFEIR